MRLLPFKHSLNELFQALLFYFRLSIKILVGFPLPLFFRYAQFINLVFRFHLMNINFLFVCFDIGHLQDPLPIAIWFLFMAPILYFRESENKRNLWENFLSLKLPKN